MKKIIIILVVIAAIIIASFLLPLEPYYNMVLEWVDSLGFVRGSTVFILFYIICVLFFLPGVLLTIFAGYQHGVLLGTLLSCIGGTLGAMAAFYLGKLCMCFKLNSPAIFQLFTQFLFLVLANKVRKWADEAPFLKKIVSVIDNKDEGWKVVLLLRISPLTPYSLLNYLLSITKMSTFKYFVSTTIGMIPGTAMYCYLGTTARNIKDVILNPIEEPSSEPKTPNKITVDSKTKMWIMIGGLIVSVIIAVVITLYIRRVLNKTAEQYDTQVNGVELEEYNEEIESEDEEVELEEIEAQA